MAYSSQGTSTAATEQPKADRSCLDKPHLSNCCQKACHAAAERLLKEIEPLLSQGRTLHQAPDVVDCQKDL